MLSLSSTGMDPTPAPSTVIESCLSSEASALPSIVKLLEISLFSAEDLPPISKSMQIYAAVWINPNRKRTTRTDLRGRRNPEWTEKFSFRLDNNQLEDTKLTVEIYTVSWFRDVLVGTVRVSVKELIAPLLQTAQNRAKDMRFVTLQIRRPSGAPQGKLNMGVGLLESSMRSIPPDNFSGKNLRRQRNEHYNEDDDGGNKLKEKTHLWRSMSAGSDLNKVPNDSTWESGSDLGSSASGMAEEVARKMPPPWSGKDAEADDGGSSILEVMTIEEAKERGYKVATASGGEDDNRSPVRSRRSRRNSDGGGLFSCLAYGVEFRIACGASKKPSGNRRNGGRRKKGAGQLN